MKVRIVIGLAGTFALLFFSACTSLDNGLRPPRQKSTAAQRVERFAKSLTRTMTDAASDVLPIVTATSDEMVDEIKSELPKMTDELRSQMSHVLPTRDSGKPGR